MPLSKDAAAQAAATLAAAVVTAQHQKIGVQQKTEHEAKEWVLAIYREMLAGISGEKTIAVGRIYQDDD